MKRRSTVPDDERRRLLGLPALSLDQAAAVLGVGVTALRDAMRRGDLALPTIAVGTRVVVPGAALRRLLGDDAS